MKMKTAYAALLRLYPATWREIFGQEMTAVFEEVEADRRSHGFLDYCVFLLVELSGLLRGAFSTWGDEYMARSRRKLALDYWAALLVGAAITAFFQAGFYGQITRIRVLREPQPPPPQPTPEYYLPLLIAGGVLLLISVFSIAFVWNMRIIGNRMGRLKPIWMPGGENARIARRDQALHRNTGRGRRELHRRPGRSNRLSGPERFRKIYNLEDDHGPDRAQ
ncbi:MAG TPA: hypothetical protein VHA14_18700 [Bryobacteraceae bacterium]|nr:hypothetical protein [Bryobacteraceae bacterium]